MYPISFSKTQQDDYTNPAYQDRITPNVWFTRLNTGGPLFNYKPYVGTEFTNNDLHDDVYYNFEGAQGGTIGVKWGLLSATGFEDEEAVGINPDLFATIGDPTHFYSFSQVMVLINYMVYSDKPVSLVSNTSYEWFLEDGSSGGSPYTQVLLNKDLACYIPATNQYFRINITDWGIGDNGRAGYVTYTRTVLEPTQSIPRRFALWPLYSDNARVYYKPHSLTTGGGSTGVTNSRLKRRKT